MTGPVPGPQPLAGYVVRDYDDLIARLGESRRTQRLTQAEVARRIGSHQPQIGAVLSGKQWALGPRMFEIADALGYDLALIPRQAEAAVFPRPKRPDGRYRCSQPGHTTCACPETDPTEETR